MNGSCFSRNTLLGCDQIAKFDLRPWQSNTDEIEAIEHVEVEPEVKEVISELSPDLLEAAVERAKIELEERKRFEYESWLARKFERKSELKMSFEFVVVFYRGWH